MNDILAQMEYLPRAQHLTIIVIAFSALLSNEEGGFTEKLLRLLKQKWKIIFILYTAYILESTVFARPRTNPYGYVFQHLFFGKDTHANIMIMENILFFVPYSFFYLKAFQHVQIIRDCRSFQSSQAHQTLQSSRQLLLKKTFLPVVLLALCTSVFIELSQLIFHLGVFQLSDILHNLAGALIGYGIWVLIYYPRWSRIVRHVIRTGNKKKGMLNEKTERSELPGSQDQRMLITPVRAQEAPGNVYGKLGRQ